MSLDTTPAFSQLGLSATVLESLSRIGYETPSPIQAQTIPELIAGRDLVGMAQTGTGKTAAFALPILSKINLQQRSTQAMVLTPTRELCIQVAEAFQTYAATLPGFHVLPIYGGQSMSTQLRQLQRGAHVVVGTPGRVMDHMRRGTLKLDGIKTLVLDEADEMLRMGFIDDVTWILERAPTERQVALFSATMPKQIRAVAENYLRNPVEVRIQTKTTTVERIEQQYWAVAGTNKLDALTRILEVEECDGVIVFVRTKTQTTELASKLEARGHAASAINGDLNQAMRERTIEQLKAGKIDILVATDVAARGIDVSRISHVINYDIPYDTEAYVHRIGRTGRAGRTGKAILFVAPRERRLLQAIEKATRQPITQIQLPTREQVNQKRVAQFKASITEVLGNQDLGQFEKLVGDFVAAEEVSSERMAAALVYLLQRGNPLLSNKQINDEARAERSVPESRPTRERHSEERPTREKSDRPDRERPAKPKGETRRPSDDIDLETYRIALGHNQQVRPADIVGAIANEAGIESRYIGRIQLFDDHSTVDLPAGMPKEVFQHLKRVQIRNQPMDIEKVAGGSAQEDRPYRAKPGKSDRPFSKPPGKSAKPPRKGPSKDKRES